MKKIFFLAFLSLSVLAKSQTTVKGIFTEQNSGNKPVVGVQIKALGANPEVSDNSGLFQLIFGAKKPGDRVIVSEIKKKGYEIVNKKEVDSWLIGSNPNQRTKIVMCPEGLIAENTAKYYDISLKAVTDGYNKRINSLQEQLAKAQIDAKSYGEQAKALSDQFTNQQNQLEELADKFARENFDDCSTIQKQAFEAFKQGNIEEAIRILETVDSEAEIAKAKGQKSKGESLVNEGKSMQIQADSVIQQNIAKLMFQGDMYAANYRFEDAEKTYERAAIVDSSNFKNVFAFAEFLKNQKKHNKAVKWYNTALAYAKSDFEKSYVLNDIALLQKEMNQYEIAEKNYLKALKIRQELAKENPKQFNKELINTLNDLAILQLSKNEFDNSLLNFKEAISLCKNLIDRDSTEHNEILAATLSNLSYLLSQKNQYADAEQYCKEALSIRKTLSQKNIKKYKKDLATSHNNLAVIQNKIDKKEEAESNYIEALRIRKALAELNPQAFNLDLASSNNNLAFYYNKINEYSKAEEYYIEALKIVKQLAIENPKAYNVYLKYVLDNLATLQINMKMHERARINLYESLNISRALVKDNPKVFRKDLAKTLNIMAGLNNISNDSILFFYSEALDIYKDLAKENAKVYNKYYATILSNIGKFQWKKKQYADAEKYLNEAIQIKRLLVAENPDAFYADLVISLNIIGGLFNDLKNYDKAEASFSEALSIYREYAKKNPKQYNQDLASTLTQLSSVQYKSKLSIAIENINEAIFLYNEEKNKKMVAYCQNIMSYYQLLNQNFLEAEKYARLSFEIDSVVKSKNLAHSLLYQDKYDEAIKHYEILKEDEMMRKSVIADFDEFEKAGITHPDIAKIRELYSK